MYRYRGFWWAPDGRQLLAARVDNEPVRQWWIADPANPQKAPHAIRYPAAGTANADVTAHVLRLDGTRTELTWDRKAFEYLTAAAWDNHGPLLSVQSRDQRTVLILAADPATGATTVLHEERDPAWVQLTYGAPLRTTAGRLVHTSDRDGDRRLVIDGTTGHPGRAPGRRGQRRRRRDRLLHRDPGADRGTPVAPPPGPGSAPAEQHARRAQRHRQRRHRGPLRAHRGRRRDDRHPGGRHDRALD